jgi:hypothetical protein
MLLESHTRKHFSGLITLNCALHLVPGAFVDLQTFERHMRLGKRDVGE